MAISLALLGVGAGAILIYVRPDRFASDPLERSLARWSALYAGLLVVAVLILVRLDYTLGDEITAQFVFNLAAACVLAALPFLAAGIVIGLAVRGYASSIGRVYAFDLAGAGIGAAVVVPLMWIFDAPTLLVSLALVAALAALLFASGHRTEMRLAGGTFAGAVLFLVLAGTTGLVYLSPLGQEPEVERWTPLGRVLGYLPGPELRNGNVVYDRNFGEIIPYKRGEPLPDWRPLQEGPQSDRLLAHASRRRAGDRRRRRARRARGAHLRDAPRGRGGAQPRYPQRRERRPPRLLRRPVLAAARAHDDRRRALRGRGERPRIRPAPDRLRGHLQPERRAGVRAHRAQPLHGGGVRRVLRPPEARRRAQPGAAGGAQRRGGPARDGAHPRRAQELRGEEPGAQRRGDPRRTTSTPFRGLRVRHDPRQARAVHAGGAAIRSRGWRRCGAPAIAFAPGGP